MFTSRIVAALGSLRRRLSTAAGDAGMTTAEYAVGTVVLVGLRCAAVKATVQLSSLGVDRTRTGVEQITVIESGTYPGVGTVTVRVVRSRDPRALAKLVAAIMSDSAKRDTPKSETASPRRRAALYCRVSTAGQVDGSSLPVRTETCNRYAGAHGWDVVATLVDAGVSGVRADRPALSDLTALTASGEVDVVVASKLDRLGRSLVDMLTLVQQWAELDVWIVSVSDGIDTSSPTGELQLSIMGAIAGFERARIRERSVEGVKARVEKDGFVSSTPPFGYDSVVDPSGRGRLLQVNPVQAFSLRETGDDCDARRRCQQDGLRSCQWGAGAVVR